MSEEHKQKIKEAKIRYYKSLNGAKRPYEFNHNKGNGVMYIKDNALEIIEKFNDVLREYGEIDDKTINKFFSKSETKIIEHNFF